jgi:HAD superfamily phosphoserine phosphatase-like hydrolase
VAVALVDVDGTLVDGPSCERRFVAHLFHSGLGGPWQCVAAAWFLLRWAPRYGRNVLKKNKAYLTDLETARVDAAAEVFVRTEIIPKLRPPMVARIAMHRARGDDIALLTGAPDFLARPLAAALGVAHWSATICTAIDGRFTSAPPAIHPFGPDKTRLADGLCRRAGGRLDKATAYADSAHDLTLLRAVERAVAVTPDAPLRAAALQAGWEILD